MSLIPAVTNGGLLMYLAGALALALLAVCSGRPHPMNHPDDASFRQDRDVAGATNPQQPTQGVDMSHSVPSTDQLRSSYTAVMAANEAERRILAGNEASGVTDPRTSQIQAAADSQWARFTDLAHRCDLGVGEAIDAATVDGWQGPDGRTYPSKTDYHRVNETVSRVLGGVR